MKKIWLLMLMVCTVIGTFTACSSDDDGDPTPQLPVSGVSTLLQQKLVVRLLLEVQDLRLLVLACI